MSSARRTAKRGAAALANTQRDATFPVEIRDLAICQVPIGSLRPSPANARTHPKSQIRRISRSIEQFGFLNPILVDACSQIVVGHGRWEAAKLLGMAQVPVIRIQHLSPEQLRAYLITDNRLAELAEWDRQVLAAELQALTSLDLSFDLEVIGFDTGEIDLLIGELGAAGASAGEPDEEIPELAEPVSRPGDLWQLGRHRIFCGNALESESYRLLLSGKPVDAVFTDPPYNVRIDGHASGLGQIKHREFGMASGEMSPEAFTDFLRKVVALAAANSRTGSVHYICMDWRHAHELLNAAEGSYRSLLNICTWVKDNGGMGTFYRSQHELVFVFRNGKASHRNNVQLGRYGRNRTNVWSYPGVNAFARSTDEGRLAELHPTIKPVQLVADAILDCTARGDTVLDPFLGSGTTLIAAERAGRACRGIELDPRYADVAIRRWQRHSGEAAVHAASGQRFDQQAEPGGRQDG